jgi:2-polyprenyl-6-methoxyphenol hydroxylase-like FAD-dependent oxidoreductase
MLGEYVGRDHMTRARQQQNYMNLRSDDHVCNPATQIPCELQHSTLHRLYHPTQVNSDKFPTMQNVDVLIIGGGPTGAMLALELAMQNVSFRIIDKEPVRSNKSRALVVQPRTLELLNRHGIVHEFLALGRLAMGVRLYVNKKLAFEIDLQDLGFDDTAFPSPLFISQTDTEQSIDKALQRYGHAVERPVTAEKLQQDATGVTAWLRGADGREEQVRSKYVVGCDGAHSVVRHAANLSFEGAAYHQDFILADVRLKWDHPSDRLTMFMGRGLLLGFPLNDGLFRLIGSRPGGLNTNADPTLADFQEIFTQMAPGHVQLVDPVWISRFRLHHRGVDRFRAGRMFVAGDAAHIHSPAGGQGMNTGMQDAVNLGWKLARVLRGEADDSLLDSYDVERRRVGEHLLRSTDRLFQIATINNPVFLFLRNTLVPWLLPWAIKDRNRRAKLFRFMSQLGIRYRNSPIVGSASNYQGPLCGGDRAPDGPLQCIDGSTTLHALFKGPTHHLILFSGRGTTAVDAKALQGATASFLEANSGWVKVHKVLTAASQGSSDCVDDEGRLHARYGFKESGYVLVRPDGHVAYIGPLSTMNELQLWVETPVTLFKEKKRFCLSKACTSCFQCGNKS